MTKPHVPAGRGLADTLEALRLRMMPARMRRRMRVPAGVRLPGWMLTVHRERADLGASFDLARGAGRRQLGLWLMFNGLREMGFVIDADAHAALAAWQKPWPLVPVLGPVPITWLMREAARREGFSPAELDKRAGQMRLLRWYFLAGMAKYSWAALLTDAQAQSLMATDAGGTPAILHWLWEEAPDLHTRFAGPEDPMLRAWLLVHGALRWPVLADPRIALARPGRPPVDPARPFGVNLVGHPRGRFGIGEDVRMAAQALAAAGVPYTIRDVGIGVGVAAEDDSVAAQIAAAMPYRFTIFCTTALDTIRAANALGLDAFAGQWLIGFWPWELPELPALAAQAYGFVDEVWASSRYTHDAYARSAPVPLRHMPMAVTFEATEGLSRADFGLPEGRFLFVFAYDALSHNPRKNPEACLAGFDRAFPRGDEPVGLVIKGLRAQESPAWQALEARAARDPRLLLIDSSLERGALLDLYRACDCFVSLHRAEGFGRNIAECMGLGLPVIVTGHSGNMDFTRSETAALVPSRLRPLADGDYPFGTGQVWAEPDCEAAARLMQRMVADETWRRRIAAEGQRRIAALYAPGVVGQRFVAALEAIAAAGE